jgi:hypothetical protein
VSVAAGHQRVAGPVREPRGERVAECADMLPQWRLRTTGPWCADHVMIACLRPACVPDNANVKPVPRLLLTSTAGQRSSTSRGRALVL